MDTKEEAGLAVTDALAVGRPGLLEGEVAEIGATKEGGLGAQPDSLVGSLIAKSTREGNTYRAWSMGVSGSGPGAVGSSSY